MPVLMSKIDNHQPARPKISAPPRFQESQINNGQRREQNGFEKQTRDRSGSRLFAQQSVKTKAGAQSDRDPREASVTKS